MPDYEIAHPVTGKNLVIRSEKPPTEQQLKDIFAQYMPTATPQPPLTAGERVLGGLETAAAIGSGIAAEPAAGIAGTARALNPFAESGAGAQRVEEVREALTYTPQTRSGREGVQYVGEKLEPVATALQNLEATLGDYALDQTGSPLLATIAHLLPAATLEMTGIGAGRRAATRAATAVPEEQAAEAALSAVEGVEESTGIRQLTSDVIPPESRTGKMMQQQGEIVGGGQRVAQQSERVRAVERLLGDFDVTEAARYESNIVQGLKNQVSQVKAEFGRMYENAAGQLNELGSVPLSETRKFAQEALDRQERLGTLADNATISEMIDFIEAPTDLSFNEVRNIRSSIGERLNKIQQGAPIQGSSDTASLKRLYASLSDDLDSFARGSNEALFDRWKEADARYKEFAMGADKSAVRSLVRRGDATPEVIDGLLFSNKRSDVDFLAENLDEAGKIAARQRVLQRAMQNAIDDDAVNPNKFNTQLKKLNPQIDAIFTPEQAKAIRALNTILSQTRRAQDFSVTTPTGQQILPVALLAAPQALIPSAIQAMIERPMIRNLLIKRAAAKTARQRQMLDSEIMQEVNRAGLLSGATVGSALPQDQNQEGNQNGS